MRLTSYFFLFILLCILPENMNSTTKVRKRRGQYLIVTQVITALPRMMELFKNVFSLWDVFLKHPDKGLKDVLLQVEETELLENIKEISSQIRTLEKEIESQSYTTVVSILSAFPKILKVELKLHDLTSTLNMINSADDTMNSYILSGYRNNSKEEKNSPVSRVDLSPLTQDRDYFRVFEPPRNIRKRAHSKRFIERYTLENFAAWATGPTSDSIKALLRKLNDLCVGDDSGSIFYLLKENLQETESSMCNLKESPHQILYNLYLKIALTELKGNAILQFSYMILKMYNKGDFASEAELALKAYERYTQSELEVIREVLSETSRSFYKCDPKQYVPGVTYTKLTRLLQGYIENEVNLNPYGTCRENCKYYTFTEYNGCFKEQFCSKQPPCKGKVLNCDYVDSDMNICVSSNPERRYDWVKYKRGKSLGNTGVCETRNLFKVDSWWRYLFWHCSYCLCLCDGGDDVRMKSDRYFNLREVTSDIHQNKVVTGARIIKNNKIIHIQIQQGILTPRGIVNKTSLSWKPVDNYTIYDYNVENNVDYCTLSWLEREIDTDEVFGPPEYVVTGVRFRRIGSHLNLEVRLTPINFTTGELFTAEHSYWLGNDKTDLSASNPRAEIILSEPDIPIRNGPHHLISKHNQFVRFQPSSFKTDVGQSTVPYLDSQALVSEGFPISGIGLIHRGKTGSGGFIAPKLISYDYTPHLRFSESD